MRAGDGVFGVRASCGVGVGSEAGGVFFEGRVGEGLAVGVLGEPHQGWGWRGGGGVEAEGGVLPVADVVAEFEVGVFEEEVALVKGPEGEVEGVEDVVRLGNCDDDGGCGVAC